MVERNDVADWSNGVIIEIFGLSVDATLRVLGKDTIWLEQQTGVSSLLFAQYRIGQGRLFQARAEQIAQVLGVSVEVLVKDCPDDKWEEKMRQALLADNS